MYNGCFKMKTCCLFVFLVPVTVLFIMLVSSGRSQAAEGDTGKVAPRAIVVTDTGNYKGIVAKMRAFDWTVDGMSMLEVELLAESEVGLSDYAVVWVPAQKSYDRVRILVADDGPLEVFARKGGVLVVMGVSPTETWLDIAPGGLDSRPLPAGGAGVVEILDANHPMIAGTYTGGAPLVSTNLDPDATGGRGILYNPPAGSGAVMIAVNSEGCCIIDYKYGEGHCFVSTLLREEEPCKANVLLYVQSIAR